MVSSVAKSVLLVLAFGTVTVKSSNDWTLPEAFTKSDAYIHPGCIDDLNDLHKLEKVANTTIYRTYTLCGRARFRTNSINTNFRLTEEQRPLTARPNLYIKCGDDGATSNQCIIRGGDILLDVTEYWGAVGPAANVIFQGIKFSRTNKYQVWGTKPGDITFVACQFRDAKLAKAQVLLDYNPQHNDTSGDELKMNFIGCVFKLNEYAGTGNFASLITVNGRRNNIEIVDSEFKENDFITNNTNWNRNSQLIESSGTVNITDSCFHTNIVGVSQIVSYDSPVFLQGNYNEAGDGQQKCFLSNFDTSERFESFNPNCVEATEPICKQWITDTPSSSPTLYPTLAPTKHPTSPPTAIPTMTPSANPTIMHSARPSTVPSSDPSTSPSVSPSTSPSISPSSSPSTTPSHSPSTMPSSHPSTSTMPSGGPSTMPSSKPSGVPSTMPSSNPSTTTMPSGRPSTMPSSNPSTSTMPSGGPSTMPSDGPSTSTMPSTEPSTMPSRTPAPCGCEDCTTATWDKDARGHTCGNRINWVQATFNRSEEEACALVAGIEFRNLCGPACDPARCDGRQPIPDLTFRDNKERTNYDTDDPNLAWNQ